MRSPDSSNQHRPDWAVAGAMQRKPVRSTSLESVGFDPVTNELEIEFHEGGVYRYSVPRRIYSELMASDSLGAFFARRIRHRYPGWKVQQ